MSSSVEGDRPGSRTAETRIRPPSWATVRPLIRSLPAKAPWGAASNASAPSTRPSARPRRSAVGPAEVLVPRPDVAAVNEQHGAEGPGQSDPQLRVPDHYEVAAGRSAVRTD